MKYKVLILFCCGLSFNLQAQNLVSNATFDADILGWNNPFVTASWVSSDGAPSSGNGSLQFGVDLNNNASFFMETDPIAIIPDNTYFFAGFFKIPSDSPAAFARIEIHWLRADTSVISVDDIWSSFLPTQDVWTDLSNVGTAPADAVQAIYTLFFQTGAPGDVNDPYGRWDDLLFVNDTIFLNGFE
ncbi:MAG: hypothetical protein L3J52_01185 [Proteobacteria bacterium]|nr:hypothetical protein [Pseudomonadota bacterium]